MILDLDSCEREEKSATKLKTLLQELRNGCTRVVAANEIKPLIRLHVAVTGSDSVS